MQLCCVDDSMLAPPLQEELEDGAKPPGKGTSRPDKVAPAATIRAVGRGQRIWLTLLDLTMVG